MKADLKRMLSQPLIARGISTRYITSGSVPIVDDLLNGDCKCAAMSWVPAKWGSAVNKTMVGLKHSRAGSDLVNAKSKKAAAVVKAEKPDEEWEGFGS